MRTFIILAFLAVAVTADNLGYSSYSPVPLITTTNLQGSGSSLVGNIGLAGTGGLIGNRVISSGGLIGSPVTRVINTGGYGGLGGIRYGTGLIGSGLYGGGLIGTGNRGLITTGGYGGLGGIRYGTGLIGSGLYGGGLIGTGNRGLITTGGYGGLGGIRYGTGLIGSGSGLIGTGSGLIGSGSGLIGNGLIGSGLINGGGQIISGGSRLIGGGATNVVAVPSIDSIPQTVEYSKQFFHFDSPEEQQEEGIVTKELSNVLKKNLQVVFIKAPENNAATNAALQLAKQAIEQKTDIYVLSKQNDGAQLVGQLQQIQESVPTVPDVRIVKYRTPEDAAYAKEVITSQYETTGGSSEVVNGGVAPVLNYASGVRSLSTGGAILGSGLGSSTIIGGGPVLSSGALLGGGSVLGGGAVLGSGLGSGLGTTTIVGSAPLLSSGLTTTNLGSGSVLGSGLGTTTIVGNGPLLSSGLGSTKIIGTSPALLGSGVTTTKVINSGPLISSGNYALGSNKISTVSIPESSLYLPPLKKK